MQLREILPAADTDIILPVNLTRLIWNAKKIFNIDARKHQAGGNDLHPYRVVEALRKLEDVLVVVPGIDDIR